jgi:hypothetical protein
VAGPNLSPLAAQGPSYLSALFLVRKAKACLKQFILNTRNRIITDFGLDDTPDLAGKAKAKRDADAAIVAKAHETMVRVSKAPPASNDGLNDVRRTDDDDDDDDRPTDDVRRTDDDTGESTNDGKPSGSNKRSRTENGWTATDLDTVTEVGCLNDRNIKSNVLDDVLILFPQLAVGPIVLRYNANEKCIQFEDEACIQTLLYFNK